MEEYLTAGQAGWTAQVNGIIQASTRAAYHVSGGKITPGSSSNSLTVAVEAGEANVGGTDSSWAGEELELSQGGVGPSGTDQGEPRVDAIFARSDSTLGVATGEPAPYTPDTDADGGDFTPSAFEHWTPAPDSGSRIGGCLLGFVLVEPSFTVSGDVPTENLQDWKIGAALSDAALVFGDGSPNGPTTITVNGDPLTIEDSSLTNPAVFDYDPAAQTVTLGGPDVTPTLGAPLTVGGEFLDFDGSTGTFGVRDTDTSTTVLGFGPSAITAGRRLAMGGNRIESASEVHSETVFLRDGDARIFTSDADGHLIYNDPNNNSVDLTPNL